MSSKNTNKNGGKKPRINIVSTKQPKPAPRKVFMVGHGINLHFQRGIGLVAKGV